MEQYLDEILKLVIDRAIRTGEPVGSQSLVEEYKLKISPATVRNHLAQLEENGYIMHPHTSSGRLPTEKGYREYVDNLMARKVLTKKESNGLAKAAQQDGADHQKLKSLAKVSAEMAQNASIVGIGQADSFYTGLSNLFAQPEFKDWNRIVSMSDILDRLDEVLAKIRHVRFTEPTVLIGEKCPFGTMCGCVIVSTTQGCLMGILGPMRMDYAQAIALVEKMQRLLTE